MMVFEPVILKAFGVNELMGGALIGGTVSEYFGYHSTFWMAFAMEFCGVIYYFAKIRHHFEANKLR